MFKFCYPVAQTLIKELQMTLQTSDVSIYNRNMKYPIETPGGYFHRNAIRGRAAQMGRFLTKNP